MASWRRVLTARGVTIHEHSPMTGFVTEYGRARAVRTARGELPAEAFVVAAGAWTPLLDRHLGCRVWRTAYLYTPGLRRGSRSHHRSG